MHRAGPWTTVLALLVGLFTILASPGNSHAVQVQATLSPEEIIIQQGGGLTMTTPAACPVSGCAAGQTLGFSLDYGLLDYNPDLPKQDDLPNVKVCLYAPVGWVTGSKTIAETGQISGIPYTASSNCDEDTNKPAGYEIVLAREAKFTTPSFGDSLKAGLRISSETKGSGSILLRVFQRASEPVGWQITLQSFTPALTFVEPANPAYVAATADECGGASPCYVNSADDLPNGFGTGLKDAVDAVPSGFEINILGIYTLKKNTVLVNKKVMIQGQNDASLTYTGPDDCAGMGALLSLNHEVILRQLNINDGVCSDDRNLIEINSTARVVIENNDMTGGDNAILVHDNSGPVIVRFNHISRNSGYALYWDDNKKDGSLEILANNLNSNRSGSAIECGVGANSVISNRNAEHNYWGSQAPAGSDVHCNVTAAKQLGAPILRKPTLPGVNAIQASVKEEKQSVFGGQVFLKRTGGEGDYTLYMVDHGYAIEEGLPFTRAIGHSPSPCSNFYDFFLPDGIEPDGSLELSFKYDQSDACQAVIESSQYCDQTADKTKYPLYWYNPANTDSSIWYRTGQSAATNANGQETSCSPSSNEIKVVIDDSGLPALNGDLSYTPFMVGIPVLNSFNLYALDSRVQVTWQTNNEPQIAGFYVMRGEDSNNFSPISDLIKNTGNALTGASYTGFIDTGRQNGVTYYYRLKIVRTDGYVFYSKIGSITANIPTITFTPTITRTRTLAPTSTTYVWPTRTFTLTRIPTQVPTRIPSQRPNLSTPTPTRTLIVLNTRTNTAESFTTPNVTESPEAETPRTRTGAPNILTQTAETTLTPSTGTPSPPALQTLSVTPAPTMVTPANPGTGKSLLSLFLGLLAGAAAVAGGGYWWFMRVSDTASPKG